MVSIKIVIEGGILPGDNIDAATFDNSEKFRESFHRLLSNIFDPIGFDLEVRIGASNKMAAKSFKQIKVSHNCVLLIDLDRPKIEKANKILELELTGYADSVFFMVQEMEAWILSQPDFIIKTYSDILINRNKLQEDEIFTINPEEIIKPSEWLGIILGRYYSYEKNGIKKKKKYGKLKDAPLLIANLDITKLINTFEDVSLLNEYMTQSYKS